MKIPAIVILVANLLYFCIGISYKYWYKIDNLVNILFYSRDKFIFFDFDLFYARFA